ncbi:cytokinin dehydrogenase 10-like [Oryza brachyantha]|uniref:cytokinin dehydrogenase 10-like n=1 Tax=Oryza brachyantha TaxID=4533 RepID=UPI001ADD0230|nr:cytokinin dehydrogenase 10-like [Oryza brachyantha]
MQAMCSNSSYTAYSITTICYSSMPRARLATFLVVTGFLSTVVGYLGAPADCTTFAGGNDVFSMDDVVSKIHTDHGVTGDASSDFGRMVEAEPSGVSRPSSPADIAALIRFSLSRPTPFTVAPRGRGHSTRGQALAAAGGVVGHGHDDGAGRRRRRRVAVSADGTYADVGGEQLWIDVLHGALEHGLAPRVWTDYLRLTVGGTLSNAGIGGQAFRHGPQISNVHELDVVTGTGEMITCSREANRDLFFAVLGGLGQFGVITRARIGLEPAPKRVKWVRLAYSDAHAFTADQELLVSKRPDGGCGFDYVEGQVLLNRTLTESRRSSSFFSASDLARLAALAVDTGSVAIYYIEGAVYYDDVTAVSVDQKLEAVLEELSFVPGMVFVRDASYEEFLDRVGREEQNLRSAGAWDVPHPWLNLFVPGSRIADFDAGVFKGILRDANPVGLILMYPMNKDKWDDRMTAVTPDEDVFYAVGLLRSAAAADLGQLERENAAVLEFCDRAGIGCKQYLPHHASPDGWRRHFGAKWRGVAELKARYDPRAILSPGQGIFPPPAASEPSTAASARTQKDQFI